MRRFFSVAIMGLAFSGLGSVAADAAPATQCTSTMSGTYQHVVVPEGATCTLAGATVTGNVTVLAGGTLYSTNTNVTGNIHARDAARVKIVGTEDTRLARNIFVRGTTGNVTIGSEGCKVDPPVAHNVMVRGTQGFVAICYVTTKNNIMVTDNFGPIGVFNNTAGTNLVVSRNNLVNDLGWANAAIRVSNNVAGVNLACRANTPAPRGFGNTAMHLQGQCATLD